MRPERLTEGNEGRLSGNLRSRLITALWGIPLVGLAACFDAPWFPAFIALVALASAYEFYTMARARAAPLLYWGLAWTLVFVLSPLCPLYSSFPPFLPLLLAALIVSSLTWLIFRRPIEESINNWAWTIAGVLYVGLLLSFFLVLRSQDQGRGWAMLALFATFTTDTSAFLVGKTLGKHKLAPALSQGKTREGLAGGFGGAILSTIILTWFFKLPLDLWQSVLLGILIGCAATSGDLVESLLKRNLGVKDSGGFLAGHGGVLDRFDSAIFVAPVVYFFALLSLGTVK